MPHLPTTRRVVRADRPGGPEVLRVAVEPLPPRRDDEVLIQVEAAGLNHIDSLVRRGGYSVRVPFPYAVGIEGSGRVLDAGPAASLIPESRVCWTAVMGSCASYVVAPASAVAPLPDALSFADGAAFAHGGLTAAGLLRHWPLAPGAWAVVWGASGSVGLLLVALLADRGVNVIGIASGRRTETVAAAGALHVIDRTNQDVVSAVRVMTGGRGASAIFDPVGAGTFDANLDLLAPRGCLVNYGQLSGGLPSVDLGRLMDAGSVFVTKYGPHAAVIDRARIGAVISEVLAVAVGRRVASVVSGEFPLEAVADAYRQLESNPRGKVIVRPQSAAA